jgi:hypothetical protein
LKLLYIFVGMLYWCGFIALFSWGKSSTEHSFDVINTQTTFWSWVLMLSVTLTQGWYMLELETYFERFYKKNINHKDFQISTALNLNKKWFSGRFMWCKRKLFMCYRKKIIWYLTWALFGCKLLDCWIEKCPYIIS